MPHDQQQQKGSQFDKSGKEQMPKKAGQEGQKGQNEQQKKGEPNRREQNR
jgi:hypothetical protein